VMDERGAPTPVAWTMLRAPESRMAPADQGVMDAVVAASPLRARYEESIDRDSARERLATRLEQGAAQARAEQERVEQERAGERSGGGVSYPKRTAPPPQEQGSVVHDILTSPVAKDLARTAAKEILRGVFGTARRR
jgi:uncharacterized protein